MRSVAGGSRDHTTGPGNRLPLTCSTWLQRRYAKMARNTRYRARLPWRTNYRQFTHTKRNRTFRFILSGHVCDGGFEGRISAI